MQNTSKSKSLHMVIFAIFLVNALLSGWSMIEDIAEAMNIVQAVGWGTGTVILSVPFFKKKIG
jgi:hypothetical protein